ncbi:MAG: hypothetical protein H3C34_20000 [Caldilineaceae bacterium]|nr:hypothetical protein [Caldilineaceae bacterium]
MEQTTAQPVPMWDVRLQKIVIVIGRLGLAYLFFTQLFWKLPPTFGCVNDFAYPQPAAQNYWDANGSSGLCFWLGMETIYAGQPRQVLVADMKPAGLPKIGIEIQPLAQINAALLDSVVKPYLSVFGWLIWLAEFWVFISMLTGFLTRLGGLVSLGVSAQLFVGLANIPRPYEWEWSYGLMIILSILMLGLGAGRVFGLDGLLRRRFLPLAGGGFMARLVQWLT